MEDLEIILADPTDAEELSEISLAAKSYWQYPDEWLARWKKELTITPEYIERHRVYTLQSIYQIVGFCALEDHQDYYEVAHLWIRPAFMMKGLGKGLLHETLSGVAAGAEVRVVADPHAKPFYQKQGFVAYDQVASTPPGRQLPLMRKVM